MDGFSVVTLDDAATKTTLEGLRAGRAMVLDFWHTKCVRCPSALDKLNEFAARGDGEVVFVACALSQGTGSFEMAKEMIAGNWENMAHVFMEMDVKENAKAAFGFSAVPFVVVVDKSGAVIGQGDPKLVDYAELLSKPQPPTGRSPDLVLDEDF